MKKCYGARYEVRVTGKQGGEWQGEVEPEKGVPQPFGSILELLRLLEPPDAPRPPAQKWGTKEKTEKK